MSRTMLYSTEMNWIITEHLQGKKNWKRMVVNVPIPGLPEGLETAYFYNENNHAVVIPSPLAVKDSDGDEPGAEPSYTSIIEAISNQLKINNYSVSCSLLGKGSGERHYAALYRQNGIITIFDSKISTPDRFLNSSNAPTFLEKIWGALTALFKTFGLWAFGIGRQVNATFSDQPVTIHRLGTQPLFDGVSCGLHSAGAALVIADLIDEGKLSTEQITLAVTSSKNLDVRAEIILAKKKNAQQSSFVSPALHVFAKHTQTNTSQLLQQQEHLDTSHPSPNLVGENLTDLIHPSIHPRY